MASGSTLLVHVHVLGVDDLVGGLSLPRSARTRGATRRPAGAATRGRPRAASRSGAGRRALAWIALVEPFGKLVRGLLETRGRLLHLVGVLGLERLLGLGDGLLELALVVRAELFLVLVVGLLGVVDQGVELVAGLDLAAALLVLVAVRLGLLDHALDLGVVEARGRGDGDLLLLAGAEILGRDVDHAVGVDVEGHLDLRPAARRRRDAVEMELAEGAVVARHLPLALARVPRD